MEPVLHPSVSLEPSSLADEYDGSKFENRESTAEASRKREHILETKLEMANQELEEVRADLRRSHTRNEEMNQILRQNAEDENQNSIHVELGQAVARIHELASENQQLRENIEQMVVERSRLESSLLDNPPCFDVDSSPGTTAMNSALLSEPLNNQQQSKSSSGNEEWARLELEKRFAQAMQSNAELHEKVDELEHINLQLQLENDTIADHVVLYQHQRRLIRERLRVKDEHLAALEADKMKTLERCQELQRALMDVLGRTGVLKVSSLFAIWHNEYEIGVRGHSKLSMRKKVGRSYSHSTVDELSGDEDVIVNGSNIEVPFQSPNNSIDGSMLTNNIDMSSSSPNHQETQKKRSVISSSMWESDAAVRKILQIITDISNPPHPSASDRLHCTQCIGNLQTL
ncbi:hypothetical protein DICVIV_11309 [Dictyocaulus viviparus]|uniref:Golgin subfamily A conserved domain-containing protein n=1 Tax=Dictyocaulus viviparus TaxID=29172 RepID=A0A0D8XG75_DICVI|nr:hypothetical protein DICVIV_11309 [Dictyocaulus viviparus]